MTKSNYWSVNFLLSNKSQKILPRIDCSAGLIQSSQFFSSYFGDRHGCIDINLRAVGSDNVITTDFPKGIPSA
jgi:hypothetical protein